MDFLRQHLPGLHQALRGALESLSTFVSYLMGDEVPTVERREAQAAAELGEVTAGRPEKPVEEEAQEALEGLGGSPNKEDRRLRGPEEAGRCQGESSASEQTWGWGDGSSQGSQADRQGSGTWEAAKTFRNQKPGAPLETGKESEAGPGVDRYSNSQIQESQEPDEKEVNRGETLRTWEQEEEEEEQEEEEEVSEREPGVTGGVESESTWHREPEQKASADAQKVAGDIKETEQAIRETVAENIPEPGVRGDGREEEVVITMMSGQSAKAQGTWEPEESEHWETLGSQKAWTTSGKEGGWATSGREEADFLGGSETEYGAVSGERIPEGAERVWVLEEEEVVDEKGEDEVSLFLEQTQVPREEDEVKDQMGRVLAEGQGSEGEVEEGVEGLADQGGEEARRKHDAEIGAAQINLEEVVQAEEASEGKERCWATEPELLQNKEESEGDADVEAIPEATPEELTGKGSEEEIPSDQETLGVELGDSKDEAAENQGPELAGGPQTPTKQPEEEQGAKEVLWSHPALSKEGLEGGLEEHPNTTWHVKPDSSEAEQRRDTEGGNAQGGENVEEGAEEGAGGRECALAGTLEKKAKEAEEGGAPGGENQELAGRLGADESGLGGSEPSEAKDEEVEAVMPGATDRASRGGGSLEEALSVQDTVASALGAEMAEHEDALERRAAAIGEGPERQAGDGWDGAWDLEGGEAVGRGEEAPEAAEGENVSEQEFGLEGSREEELMGGDGQAEAFEERVGEPGGEQMEAGEPGLAEGSGGVSGFTLGAQGAGAQETVTRLEAEGLQGGQLLLEEECEDHRAEREAGRPLEEEDVKVPGDRRPEVEEIDPEGLEGVQGQEGQSMTQIPAEVEPGPRGEAEGSAEGDTPTSWCEALLPGSLLDVSVPRSRVLLSRSSSQRRSRPSFRGTPGPEQPQEEPSSPPSEEEGLSAPEQLLQPMVPREPSPPRPEGIPAKRRALGHGFGLAHAGMMQELQARLGRPKPQ
ncbi:PREDICTED: apolipoprotein B receptor [Condylura cristata]|uniref:apolipoprotein B receptor n=1 Tax=Condylura cristata TaxID=143302 RepID=UPI0006439121|nr:PREDICTED: apolipoprotein B receptor [Condylura cristata]